MILPILSTPVVQPSNQVMVSSIEEIHENSIGLPIVDLSEHLRMMDLVFEDGMEETLLLRRESQGIADEVERMMEPRSGVITLLVGRGHNGANAIEAGNFLLRKGYTVQARLMVPLTECDPLSQELAISFLNSGGTLEEFHEQPFAPGLIIDGLVGTAFKGVARGTLKQMILAANASRQPILAIDVPSGLNAETGEGDIAIQATRTATMGFAKFGFFLNQGPEKVGQLSVVDLGLSERVMSQVVARAYLMSRYEGENYHSPSDEILTLQQVEALIGRHADFQNIQEFVDREERSLIMKDSQMIIFRPNEKPIICL
ncbi:MAG TPA: NAD(P)H-hydrate epimerase [Chlamydiales bacterium]|nr:NAD(P)H-hydrate epimerase [Chlamydiales bacterium]